MKIESEALRTLLAVGMYFSCFVIALSVFQIPKELSAHGVVPLRIILMLVFSFAVLSLAVFFAEEAAWKTILKLIGYMLALFLLAITGFGIKEIVSFFLNEPTQIPLSWSSSITVTGVILILVIGKGLNSKWLN